MCPLLLACIYAKFSFFFCYFYYSAPFYYSSVSFCFLCFFHLSNWTHTDSFAIKHFQLHFSSFQPRFSAISIHTSLFTWNAISPAVLRYDACRLFIKSFLIHILCVILGSVVKTFRWTGFWTRCSSGEKMGHKDVEDIRSDHGFPR